MPRAMCVVLAACCAGASWARPSDLHLLQGASSLHQVLAPVDDDDAIVRPVGFGDLEWQGYSGDLDEEEGDENEGEADDEPPMDDEGRVLARRGGDAAAARAGVTG